MSCPGVGFRKDCAVTGALSVPALASALGRPPGALLKCHADRNRTLRITKFAHTQTHTQHTHTHTNTHTHTQHTHIHTHSAHTHTLNTHRHTHTHTHTLSTQ